MSEHCGYVVKINELHPHSNADRLQCAIIFGQNVIVSLDTQIGDFGIFFPTDIQLSQEYCEYNNLVRKKDADGNNIGGYLDPDKRNIRAMRLRGERSEGLFMPLESVAYTGETKFEIGDRIEILNGHEICRKYIPRRPHYNPRSAGNKGRKTTVDIAPLFAQHVDTEQLAYHLDDFRAGDLVEITLKMHGTSQRTGYLPKLKDLKPKNLLGKWGKDWGEGTNKLRNKLYNYFLNTATPIYEYGYVTGTRRVVLNDFEAEGGFYGNNKFREKHALALQDKLFKGETVYYEVIGFTDTGVPIMPAVANSKISDKAFTKQYGPITAFSYGCTPDGKKTLYGQDNEGIFALETEAPQSDMYVYRMTKTGEDGHVVEYPPDYMRYRCEQMGVKCVPLLWRGFIPDDINPEEWILNKAEEFYDGPDPIGKTHVREGVVVRIVDKPKFCAYKHKNFSFKVLEGIAKDVAIAPDMEEAQEVENNE